MSIPLSRSAPTQLAVPPIASNDELERQITELSANINAATCRLLLLIGEFDRREAWGGWGLKSCAHWLNWKCGIALGAAREKVRVARALENLPRIRDDFSAGELSYSKVRAITRIATSGNEDYLLMIARHGTAMHVETLVRKYRGLSRAEANEQYERRAVRYYWDDDGSLVIRARLPAEQGAQVLKALDIASESLETDECTKEVEKNVPAETSLPGGALQASITTDPDVPAETPIANVQNHSTRRADALELLAESYLATGPRRQSNPERFQLVVHSHKKPLDNQSPLHCCELEGGPPLAEDTVRRIGCEASRLTMVDDAGGLPLSLGRKTRAISPPLRRALQARDEGCRFPGCTAHRFTDAHHIHHWADGGETSLDNLVLLCKHHHRAVHEGGFGLRATHDGLLIFSRPDGQRIEAAPLHPTTTQCVEQENQDRGLRIDALTGLSLWQGELMDYEMAVEGVLSRSPGLRAN